MFLTISINIYDININTNNTWYYYINIHKYIILFLLKFILHDCNINIKYSYILLLVFRDRQNLKLKSHVVDYSYSNRDHNATIIDQSERSGRDWKRTSSLHCTAYFTNSAYRGLVNNHSRSQFSVPKVHDESVAVFLLLLLLLFVIGFVVRSIRCFPSRLVARQLVHPTTMHTLAR